MQNVIKLAYTITALVVLASCGAGKISPDAKTKAVAEKKLR